MFLCSKLLFYAIVTHLFTKIKIAQKLRFLSMVKTLKFVGNRNFRFNNFFVHF